MVIKHRRHADGSEIPDPEAAVEQLLVRAQQFTVDLVVARLASEGVEVVRSSPDYVTVAYGSGLRGDHLLLFHPADKPAVLEALRDAELI
jgi:hypothetical protein